MLREGSDDATQCADQAGQGFRHPQRRAVFGLLGLDIGADQPDPVGGECEEPPDRRTRRRGFDCVGHACGRAPAQLLYRAA